MQQLWGQCSKWSSNFYNWQYLNYNRIAFCFFRWFAISSMAQPSGPLNDCLNPVICFLCFILPGVEFISFPACRLFFLRCVPTVYLCVRVLFVSLALPAVMSCFLLYLLSQLRLALFFAYFCKLAVPFWLPYFLWSWWLAIFSATRVLFVDGDKMRSVGATREDSLNCCSIWRLDL